MKNKEAKSIFSSLENFSSPPPPELWDKIEAQLDKPKKKKRPVAWWWVAAGLMAGLSLTTVLNVNSDKEFNLESNSNGVVLQNNSKDGVKNDNAVENSIVKSANDKDNNLNKINSNEIVVQNKSTIDAEQIKGINNSNVVENGMAESAITKDNASGKINSNGVVVKNEVKYDAITKKTGNNNTIENRIVESRSDKENVINRTNNKNLISNKTAISLGNGNSVVATSAVSPAVIISKKNSVPVVNDNSVATTVPVFKNNTKLANSNKTKHNQPLNIANDLQTDAIVVNKKTLPDDAKTSPASEMNNSYQKNNFDPNKRNTGNTGTTTTAVAQSKQNNKNAANTNFNTTAVNEKINVSEFNNNKTLADNSPDNEAVKIKEEVAQLNALAELDHNDKEKKKKTSEVIDKWSLQVFAGVMTSDNFTNEKALGNTVASKQSNGYGLKTNYKLNKKWAVSSGFKINELGQKIAGVSYYERSASNPTNGLIYDESLISPQGSPSASNSIVFASSNENYLFAANSKTASGFETGNVTQNLKYFEMPIEISYSILNKKKTNIIMNTGGFVGKLISNEMLLNGNSIGENNNVNEYVYGTVLSSTLQYEFYKKTKFFIEPGMNYYVNPLENQTFNQFQWVFNVGINVAF